VQRLPQQLRGSSWCPTKLIHTRVLCPRDKQDLARHRSQACVPDAPEVGRINLVVQRTQPSSWGWSALVEHPDQMQDRKGPPGAPGKCGLNNPGTHGTSATADPGGSATIRSRGRSSLHPLEGGSPEGLCGVDRSHQHHTLM